MSDLDKFKAAGAEIGSPSAFEFVTDKDDNIVAQGIPDNIRSWLEENDREGLVVHLGAFGTLMTREQYLDKKF